MRIVTTADVLTGFKYIAATIDEYEATKSNTFLFGFEESFGYLVATHMIKMLFKHCLEVAAYYKSQGRHLQMGVQELFEKFGYFEEKTISLDFPGICNDEMAAILQIP